MCRKRTRKKISYMSLKKALIPRSNLRRAMIVLILLARISLSIPRAVRYFVVAGERKFFMT